MYTLHIVGTVECVFCRLPTLRVFNCVFIIRFLQIWNDRVYFSIQITLKINICRRRRLESSACTSLYYLYSYRDSGTVNSLV